MVGGGRGVGCREVKVFMVYRCINRFLQGRLWFWALTERLRAKDFILWQKVMVEERMERETETESECGSVETRLYSVQGFMQPEQTLPFSCD